ncbi:hypothetical protein LPP1_g40 [Leptolyngbya phage LPP-1]|uniref:Uncharacterized protein n=1 Tax=Leptolyngbya phage LPP-1 TaxID=2996049 RepID=A0AAE9THR4_9CAUD|nr:hypothetical protein LPP1_g40 [Leptolyngbya phage LPP-1]
MSKKSQPQVVYAPMPTPTQLPAQSAEQAKFLTQMQEQMAKMQQSYDQQVRGLNEQYTANSSSTSSILAQLQQQLASQQQLSAQAASELSKARESSAAQTALMEGMRNMQQGQLADARTEQNNLTSSLLGRMSRRRQARQVVYSA